MKTILKTAFILFFLTLSPSFSNMISDIKIEGNSRIENSTILELIDLKKNKNYSINDINEFQKKLYESFFFENINLKLVNKTLIIKLKENPLVEFFFIEGVNNKARVDLIYENVKLGQNKIFSKFFLEQDLKYIEQLYKDAGYYNVKVSPKISKLDNNNLNIVLKVERGEKYHVNKIYFIGDKKFKSSILSDVISTSEYGWWKFLSSSSILIEKRLEYDKSLLKIFYLNEGFYDMQILSSDIEIKNDLANITFSINAGSKYNFSQFDIIDDENNLSQSDIEYINKIARKTLRDDYSVKKITFLRNKIFNYLELKKIEFIKLGISTKKALDNKIFVTFKFSKDKLNYVNRINIKGNSITEEEVIRRNLAFSEGDSFSQYKLSKSLDNLKVTQIFKDIKTTTKKVDEDLIDVNVEVEEQPTGAISAGVGVGTTETAVSTSITEKNLFGKGIITSTNLSLGTEKVQGKISNILPDFKNSDNDLSLEIFALSTDFENAGYESKVVGFNSSISYDIFEDISFKPGIGVDFDKIDTNDNASAVYKSREGDYVTFKGIYTLSSDKRNRKFQTTDGYRIGLSQGLAIPGSDIPYIENSIFGSYYQPLSDEFIFSIKGGLSSINSYNNKDVKLSDRKFLSSRNLRGFENMGVGPKDGSEHVGGNYSAYTNLATTFPNPFPDKWNANSIVFVDAGNVWGVDYDSSKDSNKIRSSAGLGLDWISPLGPLSFIFAQTLSSADGDLEESFNFQIGSAF